MSKVKEETALALREETSTELAPTAHAAAVQAEVQAAIIVAKKFPRNEDQAYQKLMRACQRTSFADDAIYSYPRGGTDIEGPSVNLAREAGRVWGNLEYGFAIVREDETERHIRGFAWDKETNTKNFAESSFKKLIFRKGKGNIVPDERELRELTNKHGAILERNALLKTIPKDFIEDAMARCRETLKNQAAQDPDGARKRLILAFSEFSITPEMLERKLGHALAECTPAAIANLRKIYTSIKDGNSTWADHVNGSTPPADAPKNGGERGSLSMDDLKAPEPKPEASAPAAATPPAAEELKPDPGEQEITDDQYTVIQDALQESGLKLGDVQKFMKTLGYAKSLARNLKQKDYDRVLRFVNSGGNEQ